MAKAVKTYRDAVRITEAYDIAKGTRVWQADALFDKNGFVRKSKGRIVCKFSKEARQYTIYGSGDPDIEMAASLIKRATQKDGFYLRDAVPLISNELSAIYS